MSLQMSISKFLVFNRKGPPCFKQGGPFPFPVLELELVVQTEADGVEVHLVFHVNIDVFFINVIEGTLAEVGVEVFRLQGPIVGDGVFYTCTKRPASLGLGFPALNDSPSS